MNCFNHKDVVAIGSCKYCSKGLCYECATDLGHGLACKNVHEKEVSNIHMIVEKNSKIYSEAGKNTLIAPIFYLFMGLVFFIYGIVDGDDYINFLTVMGSGFIIFAIVVFVRNRRLFGKRKV